MCTEWIKYVDSKRQTSFLRTLEALSGLQDPETLNFIVIGALPLLISGYLKYVVFWDFDLLFKDKKSLLGFRDLNKPEDLRVVELDDQLMTGSHITSLHAAWTFGTKWINVDYILKPNVYDFYAHAARRHGPLEQSIINNGRTYTIRLYMAHPWDVIAEKVLSPRTARDLELGVDTSIDIRHIMAVFNKDGTNRRFWDHVMTRAPRIGDINTFKATFWRIITRAGGLGYTDTMIPDIAITMLGRKTRQP